MEPICRVVGAGDFSPENFKKNKDDLVIAADAGYRHLNKAGIRPDLFMGDGDSLGFFPKETNVVVLPQVKDDTDSIAALRYGIKQGYRLFYLYGALGGKRFSHSLANLQALSFLHQNGAVGVIIDPFCRVEYLPPETKTKLLSGGLFSLFSMEGEARISIENAKYPLQNAVLTPNFPLGISNEGTDQTIITVHSGSVFLVREV